METHPLERSGKVPWEAVLADESTARILADIGNFTSDLSAKDHPFTELSDEGGLRAGCVVCGKEINVFMPGNDRRDAPLKNWQQHCKGIKHLKKVRNEVAAAAAEPVPTVHDTELEQCAAARQDVTTLMNPATMRILPERERTVLLLASSSSSSVPVAPSVHLNEKYRGVFVPDAASETSMLLKATINDETGAVTNCHSQDCIHCVKKMYNAADNAARCLMMGSFEVTHNHSKLAFLRFGPGAT